jgi:hypothetical protein
MSSRVHLYDWVHYRFDADGDSFFTEVAEPSGYRTLRIGFHAWNIPFDPDLVFAQARINRRLKAMGLDFDRWDERIVAAVPASYSMARIELLKLQCPDLLIELV